MGDSSGGGDVGKESGAAALVAALVVSTVVAVAWSGEPRGEGFDSATLDDQAASPSVEAYFLRESYRPGEIATLVIETSLRTVDLQIFRTGDVAVAGLARDEMAGAAVSETLQLELPRPPERRTIRVPVGDWPSGVYYAELRAADGRIGYAPFVLAPRQLGQNSVAVVMPTNTWAAYNRRDGDGDGVGDTWYANWRVATVDISRPFLDRGVPPHFNRYDLPFLRWLFLRGMQVDVISQRELENVPSGDLLSEAYDLVIFPGHHEYVTKHEYDVVERFRDLGGNLMFLSANNFFWRVVKRGDRMTKIAQWRALDRPEAALVGVQYIANDRGKHQGSYRVQDTDATAWLVEGTDLGPGSTFGRFGVEIDRTAPASPPGTQIVAEARDLFAPGKTAQMTYYETPSGARVFAAGAFTLAGGALWPPVSTLLENLFHRLTAE
jgi:N,N-dimethylformamidase beta subunit-like protein